MDKYYPFYLSVDENVVEMKSQLIENENIIAFFDTRNVICEEQIRTAVYRTVRSFKFKNAIANQFNIELMLHLAGTHQIKIALDLFDLQIHTKELIIIHLTGDLDINGLQPGFPSFNPNSNIYDKLGIKDQYNACKEIISLGARLLTDYE